MGSRGCQDVASAVGAAALQVGKEACVSLPLGPSSGEQSCLPLFFCNFEAQVRKTDLFDLQSIEQIRNPKIMFEHRKLAAIGFCAQAWCKFACKFALVINLSKWVTVINPLLLKPASNTLNKSVFERMLQGLEQGTSQGCTRQHSYTHGRSKKFCLGSGTGA